MILNVDDDMDDREMFQAAMHAIDPTLACLQFESGIQALEYIAKTETKPDLIFIDINMPKMNGYECVEHIKQIAGSEHVQIVMYSTAFNPKQQQNFKYDDIRYVQKTSRFSELVESITIILAESRVLVEKPKR